MAFGGADIWGMRCGRGIRVWLKAYFRGFGLLLVPAGDLIELCKYREEGARAAGLCWRGRFSTNEGLESAGLCVLSCGNFPKLLAGKKKKPRLRRSG